MDPFPTSAKVQLRYTNILTGVQASGSSGYTIGATTYKLQLNSLFEPLDGDPLQPYGFDQMAALYGRYKVHKVGVKLQWFSHASPGTVGAFALHPPEDATTIASTVGFQTAAKSNVSTQIQAAATSGGGGVFTPLSWSKTYNLHEVLGISRQEFESNVEEYSALVGANPARMPLLELGCWNMLGTASATYAVVITLVFDAEFSGRIQQASS